jgi:pimeloyl-ACP methyl ester carboxylesterase
MRWRAFLLAMTCLLVIGGCGDEPQEASTSTTAAGSTTTASGDGAEVQAPAPLTACGPVGWHPLRVRSGPGKMDVVVRGRGESAIVLANESGDQACAWVPYAKELAGRGFTVAVFSYLSLGNPEEIAAIAEALRARGAKRVAAIGASIGGRAVVELAAMPDPAVDAVISLSAERQVGQYPDILPKAKQVELPSLYVSSRGDGYTMFGKETAQLHDATPAEVNEILLVPGSGHGVDLVEGKAGQRVRPAIIAFLGNLGFGAS